MLDFGECSVHANAIDFTELARLDREFDYMINICRISPADLATIDFINRRTTPSDLPLYGPGF